MARKRTTKQPIGAKRKFTIDIKREESVLNTQAQRSNSAGISYRAPPALSSSLNPLLTPIGVMKSNPLLHGGIHKSSKVTPTSASIRSESGGNRTSVSRKVVKEKTPINLEPHLRKGKASISSPPISEKKEALKDDHHVCIKRPDSSEARKGSGAYKGEWKPWCKGKK